MRRGIAITRLLAVQRLAWDDLTARETQCCSFFTFELSRAAHGLRLHVQVPPEQVAVLDAFAARAERLAT